MAIKAERPLAIVENYFQISCLSTKPHNKYLYGEFAMVNSLLKEENKGNTPGVAPRGLGGYSSVE